eukprot:173928-Chlamydomonas_euryale.AAC.1
MQVKGCKPFSNWRTGRTGLQVEGRHRGAGRLLAGCRHTKQPDIQACLFVSHGTVTMNMTGANRKRQSVAIFSKQQKRRNALQAAGDGTARVA